jgi:hypothetical protein
VIETYRMLGAQREEELLREARRLQAGAAARNGRRGRQVRRLETLRGRPAALLRALVRSFSLREDAPGGTVG